MQPLIIFIFRKLYTFHKPFQFMILFASQMFFKLYKVFVSFTYVHISIISYNSKMGSSTTIASFYKLYIHILLLFPIGFTVCSSMMRFTLLGSFSFYLYALMTSHSFIATLMIYCFFPFCFLFIYKTLYF